MFLKVGQIDTRNERYDAEGFIIYKLQKCKKNLIQDKADFPKSERNLLDLHK